MHITFIDSLQFYKGSLDTLASNLNNEDFKHLISEFDVDKLEILKRKDACPYEWVNTHLYLKKKNTFIYHKKMVNEIEIMDLFLMNNIHT